jgi:uncharacterized protein YjbI with pentapeptide repeats
MELEGRNSVKEIGAAILDLSRVSLTDADLSGRNFQDANLASSGFTRANLSNATFVNANLSGARLDGVDLRFTNLLNARAFNPDDHQGVFYEQTILPDGTIRSD